MIEINSYTKTYGDKKAVDNLNLKIEKGDIYGFIGHNGAGKTTTIKSLVGILDFDSGDILIDGISIKKNPIHCKKRIAYIPDNPDIYEYLTGIEYINFVADVYNVSKEKRELLIKQYAKLLDIEKELGDLISSYSHGMKQKVALISAFVHEPDVYVLDEPFVGLDPASTVKLKKIMKDKCSEGCIFFFSTHILEVAEKLCNKVAIIKKGKLVYEGEMKTKIKSLEDIFMETLNEK